MENKILKAAKPLGFSTEMVRAILKGIKTETRRPNLRIKIKPGDYIYVREAYVPYYPIIRGRAYKADWNSVVYDGIPEPKWTPAIHMKKEHSRIFLRVLSVHREPLQDITIDGIFNEGVFDTSGPVSSLPQSVEEVKKGFINLWNTIYQKKGYGWENNTVVDVIRFEKAIALLF